MIGKESAMSAMSAMWTWEICHLSDGLKLAFCWASDIKWPNTMKHDETLPSSTVPPFASKEEGCRDVWATWHIWHIWHICAKTKIPSQIMRIIADPNGSGNGNTRIICDSQPWLPWFAAMGAKWITCAHLVASECYSKGDWMHTNNQIHDVVLYPFSQKHLVAQVPAPVLLGNSLPHANKPSLSQIMMLHSLTQPWPKVTCPD